MTRCRQRGPYCRACAIPRRTPLDDEQIFCGTRYNSVYRIVYHDLFATLYCGGDRSEREKEKKLPQKQVNRVEKKFENNATYVRLYVLYNIYTPTVVVRTRGVLGEYC